MDQHLNPVLLNRIEELVKELDLKKHPEGGFYAENYRSDMKTKDNSGVLMTSIYFLLTSENVSNFHRIKNDELWFHHEGSPIAIHTLQNGKHQEYILTLQPFNPLCNVRKLSLEKRDQKHTNIYVFTKVKTTNDSCSGFAHSLTSKIILSFFALNANVQQSHYLT